MVFKTEGVCAQEIEFEVENDVIKKIQFVIGCRGSLQAISNLK